MWLRSCEIKLDISTVWRLTGCTDPHLACSWLFCLSAAKTHQQFVCVCVCALSVTTVTKADGSMMPEHTNPRWPLENNSVNRQSLLLDVRNGREDERKELGQSPKSSNELNILNLRGREWKKLIFVFLLIKHHTQDTSFSEHITHAACVHHHRGRNCNGNCNISIHIYLYPNRGSSMNKQSVNVWRFRQCCLK